MYNIRSFYNLSDMTIEETGRHFAPPLYTRRSAGHATQRAAPEQQLSVLDLACAYRGSSRGKGETVFGFMPVEITDGGVAKINNYYVSGDDPQLLLPAQKSSDTTTATIRYVP